MTFNVVHSFQRRCSNKVDTYHISKCLLRPEQPSIPRMYVTFVLRMYLVYTSHAPRLYFTFIPRMYLVYTSHVPRLYFTFVPRMYLAYTLQLYLAYTCRHLYVVTCMQTPVCRHLLQHTLYHTL